MLAIGVSILSVGCDSGTAKKATEADRKELIAALERLASLEAQQVAIVYTLRNAMPGGGRPGIEFQTKMADATRRVTELENRTGIRCGNNETTEQCLRRVKEIR